MSPREVWSWMKEFRSGLMVVLSLLGLGFTAAVLGGGYVGLPERTDAIEKVNERQDSAMVEFRRREMDLGRKVDRVLCLVEAIAAEQDPVARGCVR